ncbi:uncharacterized protein NEMAJ01_0041 [Nematocida major]|uniref:uncharacterized protein n=1 Tax=Nematocida major TaxID=1912982 RepID=UPI002007C372|nr:uncharacterized protein NEMAJ01_0041 [Nematocida major]KAH9385145.1 hypothetical protein NEMAJ01_0041 [Nematocida major]
MKRINGVPSASYTERIKDIVPQIRKYAAARIGGGETIRCLRDTLKEVGLKWKKQNVPYKHQKVLREREKKHAIEERDNLRDQGIMIKRKRLSKKEELRRKRKHV